MKWRILTEGGESVKRVPEMDQGRTVNRAVCGT
jgi:hypothetical protein